MGESPDSDDKVIPASLKGCNCLAILAWGAIVAPVGVGFALGVAVVAGGEVLFG